VSEYRLLSYAESSGVIRAGLLIDRHVYGLAELKEVLSLPEFPSDSVFSILGAWDVAKDGLSYAADQIRSTAACTNGRPLSEVNLATPVLYPGVLYCAGANYSDHLLEMTGKLVSKEDIKPYFFLKTPRASIVGPGATVVLPDYSNQVDWEAEIAMVISKEARQVSEENAMEYVAGFTILNDLSARDHMKRTDVPFLFDWIGQKCFEGSAPVGPWITPREFVKDPYNIPIQLWVNGDLQQDSNSSEMIYGYQEQIAYLSRHVTLYPGDIIATGTPAGVGHARGKYLKPGDRIRIAMGELGELETEIAS
jgi:2-keto-4-pentenoate hydratase/2-oxohepta-3-ene-1,7-dioic acid hydratase in catechol pathway